jgi:amino acid transporter
MTFRIFQTNNIPGLGSGGPAQAFTWLLNLSTVAGLIAWATLSFCYIRFHAALKAQGVSRDSLPWKGPLQPYAALVGFIGSTIITLVCGFPVFLKGNWNASDFIASYIGIPIFILPIIAWKLWHGTKVSLPMNIIPFESTTDSIVYSSNALPPLISGQAVSKMERSCLIGTRATPSGGGSLTGLFKFLQIFV